jgi:hypothetical protein
MLIKLSDQPIVGAVLSQAESILADELQSKYEVAEKFLIRKNWGAFIAQWEWEWFITMTFSQDVHPERALKLFAVWRSKLNRKIYGRNWYKKHPHGIQTVLGIERTKANRIHFHAVARLVKDAHRLQNMDSWYNLDETTGFARISNVDSTEAVSQYVCKYITKDAEVVLSENLRELCRQDRLI